eukprot:6192423-Pleurochrysis_carterae.AAC.2
MLLRPSAEIDNWWVDVVIAAETTLEIDLRDTSAFALIGTCHGAKALAVCGVLSRHFVLPAPLISRTRNANRLRESESRARQRAWPWAMAGARPPAISLARGGGTADQRCQLSRLTHGFHINVKQPADKGGPRPYLAIGPITGWLEVAARSGT